MSDWLQDIRYGLRILARSPGTTAVAITAMAIAIAAATTMFGVVDALLLRPLPFPEPDRLVAVWQVEAAAPDVWLPATAGNYADWRRLSRSFERLGAGSNRSYTLTSFDPPETPLIRQVAHGYFETLGVEPALGRTFTAEEDRPGGRPVVLLSHELWSSRFGADPGIVGRTTELDEVPYEIVGVMPAGYDNPAFGLDVSPQAWVPLATPASGLDRRATTHLVVARLAPGVSVAQADEELARISAALAEEHPESNRSVTARVTPLAERMVRPIRPSLLLLAGSVLLVLLVATGNVANLLLTRALGRRREIAVRRALGAGAGRMTRLLIAEGLVLALASGACGLLLASWAASAVTLLIPTGFNVPQVTVAIDGNTVAFTFGISLACGLAFGLVLALTALRGGGTAELGTAAGRASTGRSGRQLRNTLVVTEVALALVLLVGAGLTLRSFARLRAADPGFEPAQLLTFRVSTRGAAYREGHQREAFFRRVQERLRELPEVVDAGAAQALPFYPQFASAPVSAADRPPAAETAAPRAMVRRALPGYLETLAVPLLAGRMIDPGDDADAPPVAVVSRTLARRLWGNDDPLGEAVTVNDGAGSWRVVGVVGDVRTETLPPEPGAVIYLPFAQDPSATGMGFAVRTRGRPAAVIEAAKQQVAAVDRGMPFFLVRTMDEVLAQMDWRLRFLMSLLGIFAALGLGLAVTGIYAVLSYAVSQRRREIGIRMALGARRRDVTAMVLRGGAILAATGIVAGLAGALAFGRLLESQLYGISAADPLTFAALPALLAVIALAASWLPARRASRLDPVTTLSQE